MSSVSAKVIFARIGHRFDKLRQQKSPHRRVCNGSMATTKKPGRMEKNLAQVVWCPDGAFPPISAIPDPTPVGSG
jgi:hypothetical protein